MIQDSRVLGLLIDVLDAQPSVAPERLLSSVLDVVQVTPQRGQRPSFDRGSKLSWSAGPSWLAPIGLVLGIVAVVALLQLAPRSGVGPAASPSPSPTAIATAPAWTSTASMHEARHAHSATLLPDGRVLVAGGLVGETGLTSAEVYDPGTRSWKATGSMIQGRAWHGATLLKDGTVLVTGGVSRSGTTPGDDEELASAEIYDPRSGVWAAAGSMTDAREDPIATLLPDGRVLVAGGWTSGQPFGPRIASSELFDAATRTWTPTGSMSERRHGHSATLLPNGTVLVAGGYDVRGYDSAELYDPITGTWTATGSLPEIFHGHTAISLANGTVLIAGGVVPRGPGAVGAAHAALYDPVSGTWTTTGNLTTPRLAHRGVLLPDGRVLVSGGRVNGGPTAGTFSSAELYDPITGWWAAAEDMTVTRSGQTATSLLDGRVLIVGGVTGTDGDVLASAELFALAGGS